MPGVFGLVLRRSAIGVVIALLLVLAPTAWMRVAAHGDVTTGAEGHQPEPVALVFGAEVRGRGPSPMLAGRLRAAVELYRRRLVQTILVSGAATPPDDEVGVMVRVLREAGVPASAIRVDAGGVDTRSSCARAAQIYRVRRVILVTQAFHAARALWTCRAVGIDGTAVGVPDWGHDPTAIMARLTVREVVASVKAVLS